MGPLKSAEQFIHEPDRVSRFVIGGGKFLLFHRRAL